MLGCDGGVKFEVESVIRSDKKVSRFDLALFMPADFNNIHTSLLQLWIHKRRSRIPLFPIFINHNTWYILPDNLALPIPQYLLTPWTAS